MPLDAARIELQVDAGGSVKVLDDAHGSMVGVRTELERLTAASRVNRQEQANYRREIAGINEILRQNRADLQATNKAIAETPSYQRKATSALEAHKLAIQENTNAMQRERDTLRSRLTAYQAQGAAIQAQIVPLRNATQASRAVRSEMQAGTAGNRNATEAVTSLARGLEDASFAGGNFANIVRFSGNNVAQFVTQLGYLSAEAKKSSVSVGSLLVASLKGPGGFLVALSVVMIILPKVIEMLNRKSEADIRAAEATKRHADEVSDLVDRMRELTGAEAARGILELTTASDRASEAADAAQRRLDRARQAFADLRPPAGAGGAGDPERIRFERQQAALRAEIRAADAARVAAVEERNRAEAAALTIGDRNRNNLATQLGLLQAQQQQLVENGQDATRVTRQIEAIQERMRQLTGASERARRPRARRDTLESESRLIAEVEAELLRTRREQEEAAIDETARRREAEARKLGLTLTQIEEVRLRDRADLEARYRREADEIERSFQARAAVLQARQEAQTVEARGEAVFRAEQENLDKRIVLLDTYLAEAKERFGEESAEYRKALSEMEQANLDLAEHTQARLEAQEAAARSLRETLAKVAEEQVRVLSLAELDAGTPPARTQADRVAQAQERQRLEFEIDRAILEERLSRLRSELEAEVRANGERTVLAQETVGRIAESEQALLKLTTDYERERTEVYRQEYQRRIDEQKRFADRVAGALEDAFNFEQRLTDLDIEYQQARFAEQERALQESLRNREISAREFDLEMRRLAQERAQFEKSVEEDRAGFVARSWQGLTALVIAEIQRQVAAWIAAQIVMGILSGGLSLIGPGVIGRFAPGGFVGRRGESGRDRVPIVVGRGEAVINRHQQKVVEAALWEKYGWGLDALFRQIRRPHYLAGGGFAGADRAALVAAARPAFASGGFASGAGFDDSRLAARLDSLEAVARSQTRAITEALAAVGDQVSGSVGDPQKARRLAQLSNKRARDTDPRRPR